MNKTTPLTEQSSLEAQQNTSSRSPDSTPQGTGRHWVTPEFEKLPIANTQFTLNDGSDDNYS